MPSVRSPTVRTGLAWRAANQPFGSGQSSGGTAGAASSDAAPSSRSHCAAVWGADAISMHKDPDRRARTASAAANRTRSSDSPYSCLLYTSQQPGPEGRWLLIDWKTGSGRRANPLQLAIYRLAWAELMGVEIDRIEAAFYDVRHDELIYPASLPDRAGLEAEVTRLVAAH